MYESVPAGAHAYKMSMVIQASPGELMDYFARDLKWLEKGSRTLEVNVDELDALTDMTRVGQSVRYNFKILSFNFPCRMICLKYRPDRELWWLQIMPRYGWILLRFDIQPVPEGSKLHLRVLGQIAENMRPILDNPRFMYALTARADQILTLVQAEFEPDLEVDEILSKGLRGDLYQTLLMGHQATVWVDASPDKVKDWVVRPENLKRITEQFKMEDRHYDKFYRSVPGDLIYAPAVFESGILKVNVDTFSLRMKDYIRIYLVAFGGIGYLHSEVQPDRGGTVLTMKFVGEIPGGGSPEIMNLMVFAGGMPQILKDKVMMIKVAMEGSALGPGEILHVRYR